MQRHPINVVLQDIRSALNVGAIFRTSDGALIEKLYLTGITPYPPHNRIPKTALGAIDTVPWERNQNTRAVIDDLAQKMPLVAVEINDQAQVYTDYKFPFPCAIILGNEISGISPDVLSRCEATIKIPMFGSKESLNVATAYGIVVYEILRQYYNAQNNSRNS
jgi:tRNA G18 (ribose-2'-O)-methylase SpoU